MFSKSIPAFAGLVFFAFTISAPAQSSGAAGTIDGLVTDPAGAVVGIVTTDTILREIVGQM